MKQKRMFSREYKLAAATKTIEQRLSFTEVPSDVGIGIIGGLLRNYLVRTEHAARTIKNAGKQIVIQRFASGRYLTRTSDLHDVNVAL